MADQKNNYYTTSFTCFNQLDDSLMQQYVENYCEALQKKQKQTLQKYNKINFFMKDDQEINQNLFPQILSKPSINYFDFKNSICSINSIQNLKKNLDIKQQQDECKIKAQMLQQQSQMIQQQGNNSSTSINNHQEIKQLSQLIKQKHEQRNRRIHKIIKQTNLIKQQMQDLMNYFQKNVTNSNYS